MNLVVCSERELTFTFAICCRPSVCLSSVCNARAPYSGGWNFCQYFYRIRYTLAIRWHPSTENFTEILHIVKQASRMTPTAATGSTHL